MTLNKVDSALLNQKTHSSTQPKLQKQINQSPDTKIRKVKNTLKDETQQLRSEHKLQILAEKDRHTDTLNRLREDLDRTQKNLSAQKEFLIEKNQQDISSELENQNIRLKNNEMNFHDKLATQKLRHEATVRKSQTDFNQELDSHNLAKKDSLASLERKTQQEFDYRTRELQSKTASEKKFGDEAIRQFKLEQQKQLQLQDENWKNKILSQNSAHQREFQNMDKQWRDKMNNEHKNHQDLYSKTLQLQKAELSEREKIYARENDRIKLQASSTLLHSTHKSHDPFYQNTPIKPEIVDLGDRYSLSLNVADHEKDQYLLSGQDRTLTLSFNRNFKEEIKQPDHLSKTHRVESYTNSFFVKDIVKPQSISKNYESGTLTFTVKKA